MKLIIDTEVIKDLIETEWGYEGIRDDLNEIFEKHGTPLDNLRAEIENDWQLKKYPSSPFSCGLRRAIEIIDKYRTDKEGE